MARFHVLCAEDFVGTYQATGATIDEAALAAVTMAARVHGKDGRYVALRAGAGNEFDVTIPLPEPIVTPAP